MFAANHLSNSERKHTVFNAESSRWFNWNIATYYLREGVNISAMELAPDEDEFKLAGVTSKPAMDSLAPLVAEGPTNF